VLLRYESRVNVTMLPWDAIAAAAAGHMWIHGRHRDNENPNASSNHKPTSPTKTYRLYGGTFNTSLC